MDLLCLLVMKKKFQQKSKSSLSVWVLETSQKVVNHFGRRLLKMERPTSTTSKTWKWLMRLKKPVKTRLMRPQRVKTFGARGKNKNKCKKIVSKASSQLLSFRSTKKLWKRSANTRTWLPLRSFSSHLLKTTRWTRSLLQTYLDKRCSNQKTKEALRIMLLNNLLSATLRCRLLTLQKSAE